MDKNEQLGKALNLMVAIIDAGGEFPDACFKAAGRFNCDYETLADAYDEMTAEPAYGGANDANFDCNYC
jgi:hypothetical protein